MLRFNQKSKVSTICSYPWERFKINPEGDVAMCCFQDDKTLGNLLKQSFDEIWYGQVAKNIRHHLSEDRMPHECSRSNSCPYKNVGKIYPTELSYNDLPIDLEIDLPTQHCNIGGEKPDADNPACIMCERHKVGWENFWQEDHLEEICQKLKHLVKGLRSIHVQGIAEPFWKGYIFQILEWLDIKSRPSIVVSTTTNGTLMTKRVREQFLEYENTILVWSLDAATPATFKLIRRIDAYKKITENLKNYCQERDRNRQKVRIHNNINLLNIREVEAMVDFAAEAGVDEINFNPTYGCEGIIVSNHNVHLFQEAEQKINRRAAEKGVCATYMRPMTLNLVQLGGLNL